MVLLIMESGSKPQNLKKLETIRKRRQMDINEISPQKLGQLRSQYKDLKALNPPDNFLTDWVTSKAKEIDVSSDSLLESMLLEKPTSESGITDKRKEMAISLADSFGNALEVVEMSQFEESSQDWVKLFKKGDSFLTTGVRYIVDVTPDGYTVDAVKIPQPREK
jgi:hypothetical protein